MMRAFGIFEGGGAKGYAHIGALQAAEERGIEFIGVAGTSIGAVVAALVACGYTGTELFRIHEQHEEGLLAVDPISFFDPVEWQAFEAFRSDLNRLQTRRWLLPAWLLRSLVVRWLAQPLVYLRHRSLLRGLRSGFGITGTELFRDWLNDALRVKLGLPDTHGSVRFSDLKRIPLRVIAADVSDGTMRVFGSDADANFPIVDAVIASASYPIFFRPALIDDHLFVDGGLVSNLPAWVFDAERAELNETVPTFGFRLVDAPILEPATADQAAIKSLTGFVRRLIRTSISGARALETRRIDDYYLIDLTAEIDTLSFHQLLERRAQLVEQGRRGVALFFEKQIGPRDPEEMRVVLRVIGNFIKQALALVSPVRMCLILPIDANFVRVLYSANMEEDADDRLTIRRDSLGPAACFTAKEPVLTHVPDIPRELRLNPLYKYEHTARRAGVVSVYALPLFLDPTEWAKDNPLTRHQPIAVLSFDTEKDLRAALLDPAIEDRLASCAQLAGEHLRGERLIAATGHQATDEVLSGWTSLADRAGFLISSRKRRALVEDDDIRTLINRAESRLKDLREQRAAQRA